MHLVAVAPGPDRPGAPDVVDLLAEAPVDRLRRLLDLGVVAAGPDGLEGRVDLLILEPAEVQRDLALRGRAVRVPPDVLLVRVEAAVVAPGEDLEVAEGGVED